MPQGICCPLPPALLGVSMFGGPFDVSGAVRSWARCGAENRLVAANSRVCNDPSIVAPLRNGSISPPLLRR